MADVGDRPLQSCNQSRVHAILLGIRALQLSGCELQLHWTERHRRYIGWCTAWSLDRILASWEWELLLTTNRTYHFYWRSCILRWNHRTRTASYWNAGDTNQANLIMGQNIDKINQNKTSMAPSNVALVYQSSTEWNLKSIWQCGSSVWHINDLSDIWKIQLSAVM